MKKIISFLNHKISRITLLTLSWLSAIIVCVALSFTVYFALEDVKNQEPPTTYAFKGNEAFTPISEPEAIQESPQETVPENEPAQDLEEEDEQENVHEEVLPTLPNHALFLTLYGFGANDALVLRATKSLPAAVGIALSPYLKTLEELIDSAKAERRAFFVDLPLNLHQSNVDPGPLALDPLKPFDETQQKKILQFINTFEGASGVIMRKSPINSEFLSTLKALCASRDLPLYIAENNAPFDNTKTTLTIDDPYLVTKSQLENMTATLQEKTSNAKIFAAFINVKPIILEHLLSWVPSIDPLYFSLVSPYYWRKIKEGGI